KRMAAWKLQPFSIIRAGRVSRRSTPMTTGSPIIRARASRTPRCMEAAVLTFVLVVPSAAAQSLIRNGSFEDGAASPDHWQLMPGGSWVNGSSPRGPRYLHGQSAPEAVVCSGLPVELVPGSEYRLEGWLRSPMGQARLDVELGDDPGTVRQVIAAPT